MHQGFYANHSQPQYNIQAQRTGQMQQSHNVPQYQSMPMNTAPPTQSNPPHSIPSSASQHPTGPMNTSSQAPTMTRSESVTSQPQPVTERKKKLLQLINPETSESLYSLLKNSVLGLR